MGDSLPFFCVFRLRLSSFPVHINQSRRALPPDSLPIETGEISDFFIRVIQGHLGFPSSCGTTRTHSHHHSILLLSPIQMISELD